MRGQPPRLSKSKDRGLVGGNLTPQRRTPARPDPSRSSDPAL